MKLKCSKCNDIALDIEMSAGGVSFGSMCRTSIECDGSYVIDAPLFAREVNRIQNFDILAAVRNASNPQVDHCIRTFAGRDGSYISVLEEFDPISGYISDVFWKTNYDPAERIKMIYG